MTKRIQVNGFRAEVLREEFLVQFRQAGLPHKTAYDGAASPSRAMRSQFLVDADAAGYGEVQVERHLYVSYDLRCTMTNRSGALVYSTTFRKNADGNWFSVRGSRNSIY
tara:strand:+ start:307 stop:633 length:327 start_codon:yes stop_codon:yes gene_type:complete